MKVKNYWMMLVLLILGTTSVLAQSKTISGTVTDQNNLPLPGVNVLIKGTIIGTQTDFDGKYTIKVDTGQSLVFSYLGQKTEERSVGVSDVINIQMLPDAQTLEEVVVVGYGEQSEKKIIQNVAIVKEEAIEDIQALSPQDLLQGQASGVQVVGSSGVLGSASVIRVRGVNSLTGGSNPLIVIDGVH